MTIDDIEKIEKNFLTPSDVAPLLKVKPYSINLQANEDINGLDFPASLIGTRVHIPKDGFIYWYKYGRRKENA